MVLYLEIKTSYQPGYQLVIGSKISGRFDLVNSPLIFQPSRLYIGNRESSVLGAALAIADWLPASV